MHHWATSGVVPFNILMACVDAAGLYYLYRSRTPGRWWKAALFAACASFILFNLFVFGPWFPFKIRLAVYRHFAVVRLAAYVIFLHGTICLLGGAVLLAKKARKTAMISALGAVALLAVAVDAIWIEPTWLEVTRLRIESPKLHRPLRVAVLADLQTDKAGDYERGVFERLRAENPYLILLAGDYVQTFPTRGNPDVSETTCAEVGALIRDVGLDAPEGVFAVQGNVDMTRPWRKIFEGVPVVPVTSTRSFYLGPLQLTCLSMADSFNFRIRLGRKDPEQFHLVVGHSPDFALGQVDADLLVAGHTHGGQVRLPWIGALSSGCCVPCAWAAGLTELPSGAKLVVSRGVGMERGPAPRLRFLCRPEIVVIDLVPR